MTLNSYNNFEIDNVDKHSWADVIRQFEDTTVYQTWPYASIYCTENNLSHIILRENGNIIAAAQTMIKKIPILGFGIAFVKWGPLFRVKDADCNLESFRSIIKILKIEYAIKRRLLLRIVPNQIFEDSELMHAILISEGFTSKAPALPYRTLIVDLSLDSVQLRKALKRQWHQNLKKAEKNNLIVTEGVQDEMIKVALDLYYEMHSRKNFVVLNDPSYLRTLQKELPDDLKLRVLICSHDGNPIAARITSMIGAVAIDLIAATGEKALKFYSSYLLQWRMLELAKSSGCQWHDLCGINPQKNPGGYQFKSGLSGDKGRTIFFEEFDYVQNIHSSLLCKSYDLYRTLDKIIKDWRCPI